MSCCIFLMAVSFILLPSFTSLSPYQITSLFLSTSTHLLLSWWSSSSIHKSGTLAVSLWWLCNLVTSLLAIATWAYLSANSFFVLVACWTNLLSLLMNYITMYTCCIILFPMHFSSTMIITYSIISISWDFLFLSGPFLLVSLLFSPFCDKEMSGALVMMMHMQTVCQQLNQAGQIWLQKAQQKMFYLLTVIWYKYMFTYFTFITDCLDDQNDSIFCIK